MDITQAEQLSVAIRYFYENKIQENFVGFVQLEGADARRISQSIRTMVEEKMHLDFALCVGQSYDGASVISKMGRIREVAPSAVYVHCASHRLNLALCSSVASANVGRVFDFLQRLAGFFHMSAKRTTILQKSCDQLCPNSKKERIGNLCDTRWTQRHTSIESFMELLEGVMGALVEINQNDRTTDANYFLLQMNDSEFLFALVLLDKVMALLKPATACLQTEGLDLLQKNRRLDFGSEKDDEKTEFVENIEL
ncbi:52 kDa repressor of the inhibitor of the protein kinase [Ditylenchus destructor]|uniref:52 kDa repressor of the inhibitor of the protein kinase n=1 Tax=Ditylenchus destructor TaxID=166010 RepID=A0AAD4N116_9BILA|nr:52 kDa repressor of the inhibitor of the protein kinase [Ditylenchus destructor]